MAAAVECLQIWHGQRGRIDSFRYLCLSVHLEFVRVLFGNGCGLRRQVIDKRKQTSIVLVHPENRLILNGTHGKHALGWHKVSL